MLQILKLPLFVLAFVLPIRAGVPAIQENHAAAPMAVRDVAVQVRDEGLAVMVSLTVPTIPQVLQLTNPDRTVFDFPGYELRGGNRRIAVNHGPVLQVRLSQFQASPPITRIVVDSAEPLKFGTKSTDQGIEIEIEIPIASAAPSPASSASSKLSKPIDKKNADPARQPSDTKEKIVVPRAASVQPTAYDLQAKANTLTVSDLQPLEDKAAAGDPKAQTTLALAYHAGTLLRRDDVKALQLLRDAANHGFLAAEESLGIFLEMGIGASQPAPAEAMEWYKKAVRQGSRDAATNIALMYADGIGVAKDPVQALTWFRQAAEAGDATAQYNLALMYERGGAIPQDHQEALRWLKAAADQNVEKAIYDLAAFYRHPPDGSKADPAQAIHYYEKAAALGSTPAETMLGKIYADGELGKPDYEQALSWYSKAAEKGQRDAEFGLGVLYLMGQGVAIDDEQARRLFRAAADQGLADAQLELGMLLEEGVGGPSDRSLAAHYYQLAADKGMPLAQFRLGRLLSSGKETADRVAGYKWLMLSQPVVKQSSSPLNELRKSMSPQDIAEAEHQVDQWRSAHPQNQ